MRGVVCINVIHVAKWASTIALFKASGKLLNKVQFLILYGPFKIDNKHTSQSQYFFDNLLKMKNNFWGIRKVEHVNDYGKKMIFLKRYNYYPGEQFFNNLQKIF